jgi:hypothetical protein
MAGETLAGTGLGEPRAALDGQVLVPEDMVVHPFFRLHHDVRPRAAAAGAM